MFKDYEYGWYAHIGTFNGTFMHSQYCHNRYLNKKEKNEYRANRKNLFKQLPKIQSVVFIYGDYKECI